MTLFQDALHGLLEAGGTDLHFKTNVAVYYRIARELVRQELRRPNDDDVDLALKTVAPGRVGEFLRYGELNVIHHTDDGHRYRVSAFRQRGTVGLILRHMPREAPTSAEIGLPEVMASLPKFRRGLVLLTGQAGAGKSTTMASLLADLAMAAPYRILTLESPVEYRAPHGPAMISQREVGRDTLSFETGLLAAQRQDPDIVMVSDVPSALALERALTLAATGPLVYLVLTAGGVVRCLERVLEFFPPNRRELMLERLSTSLRAVLGQHLLTASEGIQQVPAFELLYPSAEIRERIRGDALGEIQPLLEKTRGCIPLRQSVGLLLKSGRVPREEAERIFPNLRKKDGG